MKCLSNATWNNTVHLYIWQLIEDTVHSTVQPPMESTLRDIESFFTKLKIVESSQGHWNDLSQKYSNEDMVFGII